MSTALYDESNPFVPAAEFAVSERVVFLRKVGALTFLSLGITGTASVVSAGTVFGLAAAGIVLPSLVTLGVMLGGIYGASSSATP